MNVLTDLNKAKLSYLRAGGSVGPRGIQGIQGIQGVQGKSGLGVVPTGYVNFRGFASNQTMVSGASFLQFLELRTNPGNSFAWIPGNPGSLTCVTPGLYFFHFIFYLNGTTGSEKKVILRVNGTTRLVWSRPLGVEGGIAEGGTECMAKFMYFNSGDVVTLTDESLVGVGLIFFGGGHTNLQITRFG